MEKTTLEVGDKIRIKNAFCNYVVEIERVTKTQAIGRSKDHDHVEYRYGRNLVGGRPWPVRREKWDTTQRTLITPKNNE